MPVQVFVSLSFQAADPQEAASIIDAIGNLPAGAQINSSVSEQLSDQSGTIDEGGGIVPPGPPVDWGFTLTELQPSSAPAGTVDLTAIGTGFVNGAYVVIDGEQFLATYLSATEATVSADLSGKAPGDYEAVMRQAGIDTAPPITFTVEA